MKQKKRDMGILAIVLLVLIVLIAIIATTFPDSDGTHNESENTDFNNGKTQTAAAEFIGYIARTYWAEDQGIHVVHHFEDGFYHDIPTNYTAENVAYTINVTIKNTGNTELNTIKYMAVYYDAQGNDLFTQPNWQYGLEPFQTRTFNVYCPKSAHEDTFDLVEHIEFTVVEITQ